jgi:hypothetical protein
LGNGKEEYCKRYREEDKQKSGIIEEESVYQMEKALMCPGGSAAILWRCRCLKGYQRELLWTTE